jgi:peptidyl-prolyl cis-trans isomerase C
MKRTLLALALAAFAVPLFAQSDADKLIARVNGEEITNRDLNEIWDRLTPEVQKQYEKVGGKKVFLDNFLSKQVIVQEAIRSGFAAKAGMPVDELDAPTQSALFDRYVREVIAVDVVPEEEMRKLYQERRSEFATPEQAKLRIIRALKKSSPEEAREKVSKAMLEIFSARQQIAQSVAANEALDAMAVVFSDVATRTSDHESAKDGGIMDWVPVHTLDPKIAQAARTMKNGTISGVLETGDAFQLVLVDDYRPAGHDSFEAVQGALREYLLARNAPKVLAAVAKKSAELRAAGKVEVFVQNLR